MVDTEAKKILAGRWADTGDRTDPDDAGLTPPLDRATGWPADFSTTETPRRAVANQRLRELDGLAFETMQMGVLGWDGDIDYLAGAIVNETGVLYTATVATGPATGNATDPAAAGQTVWTTITGEVALPGAPTTPIGRTHIFGVIEWYWSCPSDGGSPVTEFELQWREAGQAAWSASVVTAFAWYPLNLMGAPTIEVRVRARTAVGEGPWSPVGTATAMALSGPDAPSGLTGTPRRPLAVDWTWELVDDDGGSIVTSYDLQWRYSGAAWSGNLSNVDGTYAAITVADATRSVQARVRARSSAAVGAWSATVTVAAADLLTIEEYQQASLAAPQTITGFAVVPLSGTAIDVTLGADDLVLIARVANPAASLGIDIYQDGVRITQFIGGGEQIENSRFETVGPLVLRPGAGTYTFDLRARRSSSSPTSVTITQAELTALILRDGAWPVGLLTPIR